MGLVLRVVYLLDQQHVMIGGDGFHYLASADLAGRGEWFESPFGSRGPDAHHPPLWTVILSLIAVFGGAPEQYQFAAVAIGTTTIVAVGYSGRKIAGERVGIIAAALTAVYPGMWRYERELLSEVVLMPLVAVVLLLAYWYRERPSLARILLLSGVCAVLTLARAEQAALFVLLIVPLVLATRSIPLSRRVGWLAGAAAVAIVLMTPWTAFNMARFREPVVLSTGLGTTMAAGACDATFSGDLLGQFSVKDCSVPHYPELRDLDRSETDLHMRRVALDYTRDHITELPVVVAARVGRTFSVYRPFQEVRLFSEWSGTAQWVGHAWTVMYWLLIAPAVAGVVLLRRRGVMVYPLLVQFVIVVFSAASTFGLIRYRAGAEVPLLILAAVSIDGAWRWWRARGERETAADREEQDEALVAG